MMLQNTLTKLDTATQCNSIWIDYYNYVHPNSGAGGIGVQGPLVALP